MSSQEFVTIMRQWRRHLAIICVVGMLFSLPQVAAALDVVVTGFWSRTIDTGDLVGGAGTDLTSTYESLSDQISIAVSGTAGDADAWRIDVHRVDVSWHGSFTLSVRRTGTGDADPSTDITGGTGYQVIATGDPQIFFYGSDNVAGITIQLKLDGMSLQIAPSTYMTTVFFTVIDT